MKRISALLIWGVILQLAATVEIGFCRIVLPDEPTKAFGNGWISQIVYSPDGQLLAVSGRVGFLWCFEDTSEA